MQWRKHNTTSLHVQDGKCEIENEESEEKDSHFYLIWMFQCENNMTWDKETEVTISGKQWLCLQTTATWWQGERLLARRHRTYCTLWPPAEFRSHFLTQTKVMWVKTIVSLHLWCFFDVVSLASDWFGSSHNNKEPKIWGNDMSGTQTPHTSHSSSAASSWN